MELAKEKKLTPNTQSDAEDMEAIPQLEITAEFSADNNKDFSYPTSYLEEDSRPDFARAMRLFRDHGYHKDDWVSLAPGGGKHWKIIKFVPIEVHDKKIPGVKLAHRTSGEFKSLTFWEFRRLVEGVDEKAVFDDEIRKAG